MTPRDQSESDDGSAKCYALGVKAWHEQSIRAGWLEPDPSKPDELRWKKEGPRPSFELEAVRG